MKSIPAIASLRAFEAVARLGGFSRAAEELGTTQSAVSQHVKAVEDYLSAQLLVRKPRIAVATDSGLKLAEAIRSGIGLISETCEEIRKDSGIIKDSLVVATLPGFAVKWLFPRLIRFDQGYPDFHLSITADANPALLADREADIAIQYGTGNYPGYHVERLLDDTLFPVLSPDLLKSGYDISSPEDLLGLTALHDQVPEIDGIRPGWDMWLKPHGLTSSMFKRSRRFGQSNMVLQAAQAGLGVALGRDVLALDDLVSGSLVRPLPERVASGFSYYFVCPHKGLEDERIRAFRDWMLEEAQRMPSLPDPYTST